MLRTRHNTSHTARTARHRRPIYITCALAQACIVAGTPLKRQDYNRLLEASNSFQAISRALPRIRNLSNCGFVDRAFRAILEDDCGDVKHDLWHMMIAALLSAIGITLAAFYFCVCFRCAAVTKGSKRQSWRLVVPACAPCGHPQVC